MSFRTQTLLQQWLEEYEGTTPVAPGWMRVIPQDGSDGADTGLVVVALQNSTTDVFIQPVAIGDPRWEIIFDARGREFALDSESLRALAAELTAVADLCSFLQQKSIDYIDAAVNSALMRR